jgi:hypothetical protein
VYGRLPGEGGTAWCCSIASGASSSNAGNRGRSHGGARPENTGGIIRISFSDLDLTAVGYCASYGAGESIARCRISREGPVNWMREKKVGAVLELEVAFFAGGTPHTAL